VLEGVLLAFLIEYISLLLNKKHRRNSVKHKKVL